MLYYFTILTVLGWITAFVVLTTVVVMCMNQRRAADDGGFEVLPVDESRKREEGSGA